jgi:hypothetical protein
MKTHTLRTFYDGCELTLRYAGKPAGGTAHFELWIPGEEDPEPLATIPAIGGVMSWALSGLDLLEHYDEGKEEMVPVDYAEDIKHLIDSYAELAGDRRRYRLDKKWCTWEVSYDDDEEDDENKPLVIARDGEQLDLLTYRDDPTAGFVSWRIHWDGDQNSAPSPADAPAVYFLVETCSQQYSKECGAPTYGTQVWRIEPGKITHGAWFECVTNVKKAVKELCDAYIVPVDPDSLRVVRASNSSYCYLVY